MGCHQLGHQLTHWICLLKYSFCDLLHPLKEMLNFHESSWLWHKLQVLNISQDWASSLADTYRSFVFTLLVAALFLSTKTSSEVQQATSTWLICDVEEVGSIEQTFLRGPACVASSTLPQLCHLQEQSFFVSADRRGRWWGSFVQLSSSRSRGCLSCSMLLCQQPGLAPLLVTNPLHHSSACFSVDCDWQCLWLDAVWQG